MSYKFDTYKGWKIVWVAGDRCYAENIHGDVINHDVVRAKFDWARRKICERIDEEGQMEPVDLHEEILTLRYENKKLESKLDVIRGLL
jgi:hypothetical protein